MKRGLNENKYEVEPQYVFTFFKCSPLFLTVRFGSWRVKCRFTVLFWIDLAPPWNVTLVNLVRVRAHVIRTIFIFLADIQALGSDF